jgi:ABC-type glycerol-3-phosphate transport system substrate-binding protein
LRVWSHQGQEAEHQALLALVAEFERAHARERVAVEASFFPDFQYLEKLSVAAAAQDLPDAFELDGPLVARFVDAGLLAPLEPFFSREELDDFLPTVLAQGTVGERLYTLAAFDSAAVIYYDRRALERARIAAPEAASGYSWPQLLEACRQLVSAGIEPLSLHMNESADEWFTYAFTPVVWSGGGRIIGEDGVSIRGVLASEANVRSLTAWQELFVQGFAAKDPIDPDPFGSGKVAMDWSGHWMARSHLARKGAALGVMVLPHLGPRPVAPCGSYCWAVAANSPISERAASWVRWITGSRTGIPALVRANGAVPARRSAFSSFPEYRELPYALFQQQLEHLARPRPRTRFYATLTQRWAAALRDIAHGSAVGARLEQAEAEVAAVIERRLGARGRGAG